MKRLAVRSLTLLLRSVRRWGGLRLSPNLFMGKKLIDRNPLTGECTWHYYDHSTKKTYIETTQDVQNIIDLNKNLSNTVGYADRGRKNDLMHFARIPNNVVVKFKQELGLDIFDKDDVKKIANIIERDPEWKYLRTY